MSIVKYLDANGAKYIMDKIDNDINHLSYIDKTFNGKIVYNQGPYGNTHALTGTDIHLSYGNVFTKTISANTTFTITGVPTSKSATFSLILTNGGAYTITWPASVKWSEGTAPDLTESGVDVLTFLTPNGGTTWYGTVSLNDAS